MREVTIRVWICDACSRKFFTPGGATRHETLYCERSKQKKWVEEHQISIDFSAHGDVAEVVAE